MLLHIPTVGMGLYGISGPCDLSINRKCVTRSLIKLYDGWFRLHAAFRLGLGLRSHTQAGPKMIELMSDDVMSRCIPSPLSGQSVVF